VRSRQSVVHAEHDAVELDDVGEEIPGGGCEGVAVAGLRQQREVEGPAPGVGGDRAGEDPHGVAGGHPEPLPGRSSEEFHGDTETDQSEGDEAGELAAGGHSCEHTGEEREAGSPEAVGAPRGGERAEEGAEDREEEDPVQRDDARLEQQAVVEQDGQAGQKGSHRRGAQLPHQREQDQRDQDSRQCGYQAEKDGRDAGVGLAQLLEGLAAAIPPQGCGAGDQELCVGWMDVEEILTAPAVGADEAAEVDLVEDDLSGLAQPEEMQCRSEDQQDQQQSGVARGHG